VDVPSEPEGGLVPCVAVDVVVLTWNDGPLLAAAVNSALASEDLDVHVFVVDNGSEPPAAVPDDTRVTLVRNPVNRGVASARNQGVGATSAALVCLLDSDARLEPDALAALAAALADDPGAGLAVPVFVGQPPEASAGRAPTVRTKLDRVTNRRSTYESDRPADAAVWDVDFGIGACQLFRREAFDRVGGLDETYFYGPEDVDFCLRLKIDGWRVVQVAGAAVHHPARRRFRGLATRRGAQHAKAVIRHLWRHRRHRRLAAAATWHPPPAAGPPAVDVVVVAYRSEGDIGPCLAAAAALPGLASVTVVDHGDGGSGAVAAAAGAAVVLNPSNPGFGAGQNRGVACGSAPWLLLLNPDARLDAAAVGADLARLDADRRVGAGQGAVEGRDGPERSAGRALGPVHLAGRLLRLRALANRRPLRSAARATGLLADWVDRRPDGPRRVEWLAATALAVRREAFEEIGGFDEGFFLYGEDLDLCRRLRGACWELVALPTTWARHADGSSSATSWDRELAWWEGTLRYAATSWPLTPWALTIPVAVARAGSLGIARPGQAGDVWRRLMTAPLTARRRRPPAPAARGRGGQVVGQGLGAEEAETVATRDAGPAPGGGRRATDV
jgi:GT2 family glycosyltransferase